MFTGSVNNNIFREKAIIGCRDDADGQVGRGGHEGKELSDYGRRRVEPVPARLSSARKPVLVSVRCQKSVFDSEELCVLVHEER